MDGVLLINDKAGERKVSGIIRWKRVTIVNVLRGELLVPIPGDEIVPRNDDQKPHNYRVKSDPAISLYCSEQDLVPLGNYEFLLLEAVSTHEARYALFLSGSTLDWGSKLKPGSDVRVLLSHLTSTQTPTHNAPRAAGRVQFVGGLVAGQEIKPGLYFGVEIMEKKYCGQGTNDGTYHGVRYFQCEDNCGLFVSLDRLSPDREGTDSILPYGGQGYLQHDGHRDSTSKPPTAGPTHQPSITTPDSRRPVPPPEIQGHSGSTNVCPETRVNSGTNVRPKTRGRSGTNVRPKTQGRSGTNVRPENRSRLGTNVCPETQSHSDTNVGPENGGRSGTNVHPETRGRSGTIVRPKTRGRSGTIVHPQNGGRSGTNIRAESHSGTNVCPESRSGTNVCPETRGRSGTKGHPAAQDHAMTTHVKTVTKYTPSHSRSKFSKGDRVLVFNKNHVAVHGVVRWTGNRTVTRDFDCCVVGIEMDVPVQAEDFEHAVRGMTHLLTSKKKCQLFIPERMVQFETDIATCKKTNPTTPTDSSVGKAELVGDVKFSKELAVSREVQTDNDKTRKQGKEIWRSVSNQTLKLGRLEEEEEEENGEEMRYGGGQARRHDPNLDWQMQKGPLKSVDVAPDVKHQKTLELIQITQLRQKKIQPEESAVEQKQEQQHLEDDFVQKFREIQLLGDRLAEKHHKIVRLEDSLAQKHCEVQQLEENAVQQKQEIQCLENDVVQKV